MTLQFPTHGLIIGAVRGGHAMQYMTSRQKATEWSVTKRMVNYWCANGQIEGAYKEGSRWWIPVDVERPGEEECLRRMRAYTVRITGKKSVAVGIQDFEALRRDQMFYVDKTDFIRQWWESGETTTLITRPRRFGKTLNLSMLNCFFSVFYENRADLFEGLKVWEEKSYHKLQGRFPVIFLSFAGVKGTTFEAVLRQINYGIIEVYRRFERILDMSRFTERERQDFGRISWDMDASTAGMRQKQRVPFRVCAGCFTGIMGFGRSFYWMNMILRFRKLTLIAFGMRWFLLWGLFLIIPLKRIHRWGEHC